MHLLVSFFPLLVGLLVRLFDLHTLTLVPVVTIGRLFPIETVILLWAIIRLVG